MNDLLLRRRIAVINSTPPLPYDARIEYLEGSGTQYINLGIKPTSTDVIKFDFEITQTLSGDRGIFGSRRSGTTRKIILYQSNSRLLFGFSSANNIDIGGVDFNKHSVVLDVANREITIDNNSYVAGSAYSTNDYNYHLFTIISGSNVMSPSAMRCYGLKIEGRMDLIPVRIGTTGYMYDKVSGTLFGNRGTGDFVLGNDKT